MQRQEIINLFTVSAHKTCAHKHLYLLTVDLDAYSSDGINKSNPEYFETCANLLNLTQNLLTTIHVYIDAESPNKKDAYKIQPYLALREQSKHFPHLKPRKGDYILDKPDLSSFKNTNLKDFLYPQSTVFTLGFSRGACVQSTMLDGLTLGFNMIAIDDLIVPLQNSRNIYKIPPAAFTDSDSLIEAAPIYS